MKHSTSSPLSASFLSLRSLMYIGAAALIGTAGIAGWYWYRTTTTAKAQVALAEVLEFHAASLSASNPQAWKEALALADQALPKTKGTTLDAYVHAFKADALTREQNLAEGIEAQEYAVGHMPSSAVAHLNKLKYALMLCDSADAAQVERGVQLLQELSEDRKSAAYYPAQFYRGYRVFVQEGPAAARAVWGPLLGSTEQEGDVVLWRERAQNVLDFRS